MTRGIPVFFALLLVCSIPAMTVIAAGPDRPGTDTATDTHQLSAQQVPPTTVENTTNRLQLVGETTPAAIEQTRDLGAALAISDTTARIDHEQYAVLDREFDGATRDQQVELISAASERLDERIDELKTTERTVTEEHAAGIATDAEFRQMMFQTTQEAAVLLDAIDSLSDRAGQVPGVSPAVEDREGELEVYQTDIRSQIEAATLGERSELPLLTVETSEAGYTIETIDGTYLRETVRFDNQDLAQTDQFDDITDSLDAAEETYPWAFETRDSAEAAEWSAVQLYWVWYAHDHGELQAYFDGGTGDVYREMQDLDYNSLPVVDTERWTDEDLQLSIEQTPANGPAEVTVTGNESDEPIAATITVDGVEVGETGDDGALWYVQPSDSYELVAETDSGTINATVSESIAT